MESPAVGLHENGPQENAAPEIPAEIRETRPAPAAPHRLTRKRAVLAAGVVLGVVGLGGLSAGAYSVMSGFGKRRSDIRIGRIEDLPEIKDGVVAVKPSVPVPAAQVPAAQATASPTAASPATGSPAAAPRPASGLLSPVPASPTPRTILPAPQAQAGFAPPPPAMPAATTVAALPAPDAAPSTTASLAAPALQAPLPPPAPARALVQKAEPRPERARTAQRRQPAPRVEASAEPAVPAEPPKSEDRPNLLGVPLPDLAQTGRDIKDGVASFGEAVLNLPKRF